MLSKLRTTLICTLLSLAAAGADAQNTIHVPADQPTIQSGIDTANTGDTVLVAPGTYYENIDFKGKAITVISSGGAAGTIIDGASKGPAVSFVTGEVRSSTLSGFTIQHGGVGNGISIHNAANDVTAGILTYGSAPTILNNTIQLNNCYGILAESASPLIQNNEITLTDPTVGSWCDYVAIGTGVLIDGAFAPSVGPASPLYPTIIGNTIDQNNDTEGASSSGGGGIHILVGYTIIENNIIHDNFSQEGGGGIAVSHYNPDYDGVLILQNLIYGNTSPCGGGGLSFQQNTAFGIDSPVYYVINNDIVDNSITGACTDSLNPDGSQVYLWQDSNRFVFVNNIIAGESDTQPAVYCEPLREYYPGFHLAIFDHNDIYNSQGASIGGVCVDQTGSYGNVAVDPLFVSRSSSNYSLAPNSPLIDAGNNSAASLPTQDFLGNPRQQDATGAGYPIIDIGAYEFAGKQDANSTTITVVPSAYQIGLGDALTLTASMLSANGTPTGSLTFFEDGKSIGSSPINSAGVATIEPATTVPGVHAFIATYQAQGAFTPATSVKIFVVFGSDLTTLTLTSSLNPASSGQPVTFSVTSTSSAGTVPSPISLMDGSNLIDTLTPDSNGNASYTTSSLTVGSHLIIASYAGSSQLPATQATLTQIITGSTISSSTTILTCNPSTIPIGGTSLFSAAVTASTGTPTGSITFTDNGTTLAQPTLTNGDASLTYTGQVTGTHNIIATYVPTGSFTASSASCSVAVDAVGLLPSTAILTVVPTSSTFGNPVTLTATVSATNPPGPSVPTGSVTFTYNTATNPAIVTLGTVSLTAGVASLTTTTLPVGEDNLNCTYSGDTVYAAATCISQPVGSTGPAITLTSSLNPAPALTPITFTAQLGPGNSGGKIVFTINGQTITTTPNAYGTATTTISTLTPGSYLISANWFAADHALVIGASLTQVITAPPAVPDFSLNGTNITFKVLHSGTGQLELASLNNFSGNIALTCDPPYPANYTCTLQSANIQLPAGGSAIVNFTLNADYIASTHTSSRIVLAAIFPLTLVSLLGLARRRRANIRTLLTLALLAIITTATTACGPDHFIPITTGTFPITFTATGTSQGTSTPITHTVTINATIAP